MHFRVTYPSGMSSHFESDYVCKNLMRLTLEDFGVNLHWWCQGGHQHNSSTTLGVGGGSGTHKMYKYFWDQLVSASVYELPV